MRGPKGYIEEGFGDIRAHVEREFNDNDIFKMLALYYTIQETARFVTLIH